MARSTQQLRDLYGPACSVRDVHGALEAWTAHDACLRWAGYHVRPEDTAFRNCRCITGGTGYSLHAYFLAGVIAFWNWVRDHIGRSIGIGLALDLNWKSNPYGPRVVTDMPRSMVDAICGIRTRSGAVVFRWGGYYSGNKDAMHFEIVASPAELSTGIDWSTVPQSLSDPRPAPPPPSVPQEDDMAYESITIPPGEQRLMTWPTVGINGIKRAYLGLGSAAEGTTAYLVIGNETGQSRDENVTVAKGGRAVTVVLAPTDDYAVVINTGKNQLLAYTEVWTN